MGRSTGERGGWTGNKRRAWGRAERAGGRWVAVRAAAFVLGTFLGDLPVWRMAFAQAGPADAHEPGPCPQLLDRSHATIPHPGPQAPDQLEDGGRQRTLQGHAALDPLRDQLRELVGVVLEVALATTPGGRHRRKRAHAAVDLVLAALVEHDLARALLGAGEEPGRG